MRALLIDPSRAAVREIDLPGKAEPQEQLRAIRALLGGPLELAHRFDNGDVLLVDEEANAKAPEFFFWLSPLHFPLAGRGVILGREDHEGDATDAASTIDDVMAALRFSIGITL